MFEINKEMYVVEEPVSVEDKSYFFYFFHYVATLTTFQQILSLNRGYLGITNKTIIFLYICWEKLYITVKYNHFVNKNTY